MLVIPVLCLRPRRGPNRLSEGGGMLRSRFLTFVVFVSMVVTLVPLGQPAAALSSSIVLSQVYGGGVNSGATFKNDFIELFNRGAAAVSVTGWSVQYASSAGTSWQVTN